MPSSKQTEEATEPTTALVPAADMLPEGFTQEEYDALLAQQDDEFDEGTVQVPLYKIGQGLTREVQDGNAEAGEFIDTLTGDGVGNVAGFVVAYYQKGRFAADRDTGKAYVAWGDIIPESWGDFLGEEWVGTAFSEHPDAEETFKKAVNDKTREWKSGPPIQTTHNFTGLVIVPGIDGEPDEMRPARLSLKSTDTAAAVKWMRLKAAKLRRRPFWDIVFELTTKKNEYKKGAAYNLVVSTGRPTTAQERQDAAELARMVSAGRVVDNSTSDSAQDQPAEPDTGGGLAV